MTAESQEPLFSEPSAETLMEVPPSRHELVAAPSLTDLSARIVHNAAPVGVVGLGYVGLPLLIAASRAGFPVIGVDVNREKVSQLLAGRSYVVDVSDADIANLGAVRLTSDAAALAEAEIIVIAVPTPLSDGVPDLTLVETACRDVARFLRPGRLVTVESTTYPGATEELVRPLLEASRLEAGRDFALCYSPERIDPGSMWTLQNTPKIVSGIGPVDSEIGALFYQKLVPEVVLTPTPREAEMCKLIENTFRQVNIALVNELAMAARELGVDIWAALEAAATKPFGYMPFWPGPGVGGHCIPIDPTYLSWRVSQRRGFGIGSIDHAREINTIMPAYVTSRISEALNLTGRAINGSRIMGLGVSYKGGVDDVRESPSIAVLERLAGMGASCTYHDPYVPAIRLLDEELHSEPPIPEVLHAQDCVAILTAHPNVDYESVVRHASLVFDARGVTRKISAPNIVRL